tara:strand:- start:928 stop:1275 length:348 start_codon:yes stop_codon:yes gene_type:complete
MGRVKSYEKVLKTGRKVKIREISIDKIDDLKDIPEVYFLETELGDEHKTIKHINKAQTAWIRNGLSGGDFSDWKPNGAIVPDSVIRQLRDEEKTELVSMIQKCQIVNPKKPSSSD